MFPDNLHISDPTGGVTYIVENDQVSKSFPTHLDVYGYLIAQNMQDIYTVNRTQNSITRYKNLQSIGDIPVGQTPWGICEDPSGRVYVTNYGDNTVSVIEHGNVVATITVDKGPRGIVSDANGMIYVACYISNTVCKIYGNILVERIAMPFNPEGITCSAANEVWCCCSGSNVAVKLLKNGQRLTIDVGKVPVAIVCDKKGNVFTANFEDDTVSQISTVNRNQVTTISVGDGPSAIAVNSQGLIYVTSNLSGEKIYKINPKESTVIDQIEVCKGQSAFGDFTGCATYNCFNPNGVSSTGGSIGDGTLASVVQALQPTFIVTSFEENDDGTYSIKIDSNTFNLNKFTKLTLNGVSFVDTDGAYNLSATQLGAQLTLHGYLTEDESEEPVVFSSIPVSKIFNVVVGVVDENWTNWVELKRQVVDLNKDEVVSVVVRQPTDGHLLMFVPQRVYNNVKDGITVGGMNDISEAWANPEGVDFDTTVNDAITATVPANLMGKYQLLQNWLKTNGNTKWLFQFYKLS